MMFTGKVAMMTGASVGIGRACALRMAQEGACLILLDRRLETLEALREELLGQMGTGGSDRLFVRPCDISDEQRVNETVREAVEKFGRVDILVNNAALWRCWTPFLEVPTDEWKRFFDVNVLGTVYCTRAVLGGMLERGYGRIINVGSVAGVYGNANMVHYSATKGALIALTKALAKEVAAQGVTVNCVAPGSVSPSEHSDVTYTEPSQLSFMGRTGSDAENAALICFLASDEASYISAQNIQIDGCRRKQ